MSIRIHELAKKHNMEGRDMLALLKERGYVAADTKSVSSTVSKIYVEEIEKELASKAPAAPAAAVEAVVAPAAADPSKSRSPVGIFVKTALDVARERESVAKVAAPTRPAAPLAKAPTPPPPRPVTAP
ncbi:MAG TPA: translation initiation factor IF-2, partial [Opitutaceae bacterium]